MKLKKAAPNEISGQRKFKSKTFRCLKSFWAVLLSLVLISGVAHAAFPQYLSINGGAAVKEGVSKRNLAALS